MKCKRTSDGRALDHHTLQVMQQQAVKAVRGGQTVQSVAAAFGVNQRSVFWWFADFANCGQNALLAEPIPGCPNKLSPHELSWIDRAVRDHNPQQFKFKFKFEFCLWTLSLIRQLSKRQFGKNLSVSCYHSLMKILGFSDQQPRYQAWQQDPVQETQTYPVIRAEAKRVGATLYFGDEPGIRSDYHRDTTWTPQGLTPVVQATGRRFTPNMISISRTEGEFRCMLHEGTVGAKLFVEFLKRFMLNAEKPVFQIVDGHPINKAKMVKSYVDGLEGKLKPLYLPPYSPPLRPEPDRNGLGSR